MKSEQQGDDKGINEGNGEQPVLTTRQGHPVVDNQNVRTVGERGPTTLENNHFIEKITHFDRERIPERVVHARGARLLRGLRHGRRRAGREVHRSQAVPEKGQAHARLRPLLVGNPRRA